jgi:hypothetical protein
LARSALAVLSLAVLCGLGAPALGQPVERFIPSPTGVDYDHRNSEWNGLAELYRILVAGRRVVYIDEPVDLARLPVTSPVALIYPTTELPIEELVQLVRAGGRLLVADDFGTGAPLMGALGVRVHPGRMPHLSFYRANRQLPSFAPSGDHPLLSGVERVIANHPTPLSSSGAAVITYDDPHFGLLYDVRLGRGRAIVLGDPSLMVNFMLDVADNRTLVLNLFDSLCADLEQQPCRIHVATGSTPVVGDFPAPVVEEPSERPPHPRGVYFATVFLALGTAVFLLAALPLVRPRWLSFSLRTPPTMRSRSEFEWNLERMLEGGRESDYALPLAILKDEFEDLFMGALAKHPGELHPDTRSEPEQLRRFAERFAARVAPRGTDSERRALAARALSTLRALAEVPSRNNLVPEVDERYSERLFRRLYSDTSALLGQLGLWEEYERRAGQP